MKCCAVKKLCCALGLGLASVWAYGQVNASAGAKPVLALPVGANVQKVNEFLATLKPPTSLQSLEVGNNLKLGVADIVEGGAVQVAMSSTLPRTDAMWLLTMAAQPEGGGVLFGSLMLEPSAQPEASLRVKLYKAQHLLLVVRSGGKYYGVHRHVKVGETSSHGVSK